MSNHQGFALGQTADKRTSALDAVASVEPEEWTKINLLSDFVAHSEAMSFLVELLAMAFGNHVSFLGGVDVGLWAAYYDPENPPEKPPWDEVLNWLVENVRTYD